MRVLCPLLIGLHCGNHKQALGTEAAAKAVRYIACFFDILGNLARFYKYSGKRMKSLHAEQLAMEQPELVLVRNGFTRWLSHDKVTETLWRTLLPVLAHL